MSNQIFQSPNSIRSQFASSMSSMYKDEVPQYGQLYSLVETLNNQKIEADPQLSNAVGNGLLECERHGAIRLGTAEELSTMRRLFAVMGMHPVDYYDLSVAGIPVHSTAFRPITLEDIAENPFRVFTSLLRLDLIDDISLREKAEDLLSQRNIFSDELLTLIKTSEEQNGLTSEQSQSFVEQALETFRWHQDAQVDSETYQQLSETHRLIADVVSFKGPHINHLTPRCLDIDELQNQLSEQGFNAKAVVEGPPTRNCPILLRQTSFVALEETVNFTDEKAGTHTARFGEVEQRGVALTAKGRALYDKLLNQARNDKTEDLSYASKLESAFGKFPDTHEELHNQGLAFYQYSVNGKVENLDKLVAGSSELAELVSNGSVQITPILYEDFLPVSAAGIFTSNLDAGSGESKTVVQSPNQKSFETALGGSVISGFELYEEFRNVSLVEVSKYRGLR